MRPLPVLGIAWNVAVFGCGSPSSEQKAPAADAGDAAPYIACSAAPLALPLTETGGRLAAAITQAAPNPPAKHDNVWTLQLEDSSGAPLDDAEITFVESYMPVHDHAGVPEPTTERTGPAAFRLAVHFMMRGPWEVRLDLVSPRAGSERVVFDVCVAE